MHPILILIHLAAAVMLLLWAVRMVRTGVERTWGGTLRTTLRRARGGAVGMALAGAALAVVLQSATAVGVLAAGFSSSGILSVSAGIAAVLGADLGSSLVVKLLSFDLSELIPVLILIGATLFLKVERREPRQIGRIILGVAFILLSLRMIGEASEPLRDSPIMPQVAGWLAGDPLTAFLVAALLAWLMHSSVATLLLFASFASAGVLPVEAAAPMVLGANLGGGLVAVWLTRGERLPARRIPLANLFFRGTGAGVALILLPLLSLERLAEDPGAQLVNFHVLFNLTLLVVSLPLIGMMDRLTARLWPDAEALADGATTYRSALDRALISQPKLALASAQRELLRMGEAVERMLRPVMDVLDTGDPRQIQQLRLVDDEVNGRHSDIKLFIAEVNRGALTDDEARRGLELAGLAIDLAAVGDLISRNLLSQAVDKSRQQVSFSEEGWRELTGIHARVMTNLQIAMNVLVSGDLESARHLVAEKAILRKMERDCHDRHLARLRLGNPQSIETSDLHLEIVRALKEINSLLVKMAYPVLSEHGHLLDSRLADVRLHHVN